MDRMGKIIPTKVFSGKLYGIKKLYYEHFNPNFIATVEFESHGETTSLNWHMVFETKEVFEAVVKEHKADEG